MGKTLEEIIVDFAEENNLSIAYVKTLIAKNIELLTVPSSIAYNRESSSYEFVEEFHKLRKR